MLRNTYYIKFSLLLIFLFSISSILHSQDIISAKGTSQVMVESFQTKDQAREEAEERAMINAIENTFGTYIEGGVDFHAKNGRVDFDIIGETRVKGEWVRTLDIRFDEQVQTVTGESGTEQIVWITCNIKGEIRECEARANLEIIPLSCPHQSCRQTAFHNNENLYLFFRSPVDGYLSIFLDDGHDAFRIFPYASMGTLSNVKIKGDEMYILFSENREHTYDFDEGYSKDFARLTTNKDIEFNNLYIVFSENREYRKPILQRTQKLDNGYYIPTSLPLQDFKKWLGECRALMPDFQAKKIKISIER